jgi:hypothetical protein
MAEYLISRIKSPAPKTARKVKLYKEPGVAHPDTFVTDAFVDPEYYFGHQQLPEIISWDGAFYRRTSCEYTDETGLQVPLYIETFVYTLPCGHNKREGDIDNA